MNQADHALVIGIRRYADAAAVPPWITNLEGPDNDAQAVAEWLRKPDGGGLPHDNVRVIRSADLPDPFPDAASAGPHQTAVKDALEEIANLPTNAYGQYAGRRLYLYISGHGFASHADQAMLVTAEATRDLPVTVDVTSWTSWLYEATHFAELVLWVDCCATHTSATLPLSCTRAPKISKNADRLRFFAYAAGLDKSAVEKEMPDAKWHGAFTYALLKGLEGGAVGELTSDRLRDYLTNTMKSFMTEDQRRTPGIAKEPTFPHVDRIEFTTPPERPRFRVTMKFPPDYIGKRVTVGFDLYTPLVAETDLQEAEWTVDLPAGTYFAYVAELDVSKPFTVTGGGSDAVVTVP